MTIVMCPDSNDFFPRNMIPYTLLICPGVGDRRKLHYRSRASQGRLDSTIGHRAKQCTGAPAYTTTHRNKNVNG